MPVPALIDTGFDFTLIVPMELPFAGPATWGTLRTAGGLIRVWSYDQVCVSVPGLLPGRMCSVLYCPDVDAPAIGREILRNLVVRLDGPYEEFTVS